MGPPPNPKKPEEARRRHQAGDLQFAMGVYREVLSQDPKNAEPCIFSIGGAPNGNHAEALVDASSGSD